MITFSQIPQLQLNFILIPLAYLLIGSVIKYIDQVYDEKSNQKYTALIISLPTGILMGLLIATDNISTIVLGSIIVAVALTNKIDNTAFRILFLISMLSSLMINNLIFLPVIPFTILVIAAILDELGNDWVDRLTSIKQIYPSRAYRILATLFANRYTLPLTALFLFINHILSIEYFIYLFLFDIGYYLTEKVWAQIHKTSKSITYG